MNTDTPNELRNLLVPLQAELTELKSAQAKLQGTLNRIDQFLRGHSSPSAPPLGDGLIAKAVLLAANAYSVPLTVVYAPARDNRSVFPRQLAMYLAREGGLSFPAIGAHFKMDHGTVMHGCSAVRERLALNDAFRNLVAGYVAQLQSMSPFTKNELSPFSIVK